MLRISHFAGLIVPYDDVIRSIWYKIITFIYAVFVCLILTKTNRRNVLYVIYIEVQVIGINIHAYIYNVSSV